MYGGPDPVGVLSVAAPKNHMRLWFLSEHRRKVIKSDFLWGIGSSFRVPSALSLCQIRDPISARMANTRCDKPLGFIEIVT